MSRVSSQSGVRLGRQPAFLARMALYATIVALCIAGVIHTSGSRSKVSSPRAAPKATHTVGTRGPVPAARSHTPVPLPAGVRARLVYSADFSRPPGLDPAVWNVYDGPGNAGYGWRRASAITVDGRGQLVITASMHGGHVVSGGMALRANQTYGRFVVRVRTEPDPSGTTNGVVLTWPQSNDFPVGGESDMYETGPNPTRNFFSTHIHYSASNRQVSFRTHVDATQWHTIVMDWTASRIAVYDDGGLVAATSKPAVIPHVPQHLCLQLDAANAGRLARPVHMYVDSVKVYAFS